MHLTSVHDYIDNDMLVEDLNYITPLQQTTQCFYLQQQIQPHRFRSPITHRTLQLYDIPKYQCHTLEQDSNYRITASLNSLPRSTITIQATIVNEQETAESMFLLCLPKNFEFLRRGNLHCGRSRIQLRFEQSIYFTDPSRVEGQAVQF